MNLTLRFLLLILWMLLTVILTISFIGIMMLDIADLKEPWINVPRKLLNNKL